MSAAKKILNLIAKAEYETALHEPCITKVIAYTQIDICDLEALLQGSLSQRQIVARVLISLISSPLFDRKYQQL